jgi:hypothetical protein
MIVLFLSALPSLVRSDGLEPRFIDWANSFYAQYFLIALAGLWVYGTGKALRSALANRSTGFFTWDNGLVLDGLLFTGHYIVMLYLWVTNPTSPEWTKLLPQLALYKSTYLFIRASIRRPAFKHVFWSYLQSITLLISAWLYSDETRRADVSARIVRLEWQSAFELAALVILIHGTELLDAAGDPVRKSNAVVSQVEAEEREMLVKPTKSEEDVV